jgi:hypothetical protein
MRWLGHCRARRDAVQRGGAVPQSVADAFPSAWSTTLDARMWAATSTGRCCREATVPVPRRGVQRSRRSGRLAASQARPVRPATGDAHVQRDVARTRRVGRGSSARRPATACWPRPTSLATVAGSRRLPRNTRGRSRTSPVAHRASGGRSTGTGRQDPQPGSCRRLVVPRSRFSARLCDRTARGPEIPSG